MLSYCSEKAEHSIPRSPVESTVGATELPDEIVWNKYKKGFTSPTSEWIKKNKKKNKDIIRKTSNIDSLINKDYVINNYDDIDARLMWRIINFCIWVKVFELKI